MLLICVSAAIADNALDKNPLIKNDDLNGDNEPPEGYYAFVESPNAEPPKVRPPPYADSDKQCQGM